MSHNSPYHAIPVNHLSTNIDLPVMLSLLAIDVLRSLYAFNLPVLHHYADITIMYFDNKMNKTGLFTCVITLTWRNLTQIAPTLLGEFLLLLKCDIPSMYSVDPPQTSTHCPSGDVVVFFKRLVNVDSGNILVPWVTKDIIWANWHMCILPKMIGNDHHFTLWIAFTKHQTWTKQINIIYPDYNDLNKHFPFNWSLVNSSHKGQCRGALMFSLICAWTNGSANNRDTGDLRRHRSHNDVTIMDAISE